VVNVRSLMRAVPCGETGSPDITFRSPLPKSGVVCWERSKCLMSFDPLWKDFDLLDLGYSILDRYDTR